MRYSFLWLTTCFLLLAFVIGVGAQENPPMADQNRDAEKEYYFAAFDNLRQFPTADSRRKAYEAAIEYLKRFEGDKDPDARAVRQFVMEYERAGLQSEILQSYASKNYARTFELGRASLERDRDNFFVLSVLTQAGIESAQAGSATFNDATVGYAKRALQLLDAGRLTKTEPFKNIEAARGYLNAAVGTLLRDKTPVEAAQAFRKAVQSDSPYQTDPITFQRLGSAILRGEFAQLSKEYKDKYLNQPPSAPQQTMLVRINQLGLQALDAYARAVALSDPGQPSRHGDGASLPKLSPESRDKILEQLTALYKSFHNNSAAGLKEFIATILSKPLP